MLGREALQSYHEHIWAVWLWCDNDEESLFGQSLLTSRRYANKQIKRLLCQQSQIVSLFSNRSSFSVLLFALLLCSGVPAAMSHTLNRQMVWMTKLATVVFRIWGTEFKPWCENRLKWWRICLLTSPHRTFLLPPFGWIRYFSATR